MCDRRYFGEMLELLAGSLTGALVERLARRGDSVLTDREARAAFERALAAALRATDEAHGAAFRRYEVDVSFFRLEAAEELEKLLLPGAQPDPRALARMYVASLPQGNTTADPSLAEDLHVPFEAFVDHLQRELGRDERLLDRLHKASVVSSASGALDEDVREYLRWVIETFAHVQVPAVVGGGSLRVALDDVFVAPNAVLTNAGGRSWTTKQEEQAATLRELVRSGQLSHDEFEARLDRLGVPAPRERRPRRSATPATALVAEHQLAVALGEPGSGKTTWLRWLAVRHAQASAAGELMLRPGGGATRIPIYVRAPALAGDAGGAPGVITQIARFLCSTLECPLPVDRVEHLLRQALRDGRCLVLLDGLDEVPDAADRAGIVERVEHFSATHGRRGNRFICTSRPSGYAAAPLSRDFTELTLTAMDNTAIRSFVRLYARATQQRHDTVGGATPPKPVDELATAVDTLLEHRPGLRDMAANPLLCAVLVAVYKANNGLPDRRVELYASAVEALSRDFESRRRAADARVPRDLAPWLTSLAAWMHDSRPEGSATLRDLVAVWGRAWATAHGYPWDHALLEEPDPTVHRTGAEILGFVRLIEEHTGLLVQKAPRRWGFPHLTFEELYTGRSLAMSAGPRWARVARLRSRLHDPRYDEPILLGLGLVETETPEDADAMFEAALLARGADASRLEPSPHEPLLGRDFRFALRALADDVAARPALVDELLDRAMAQVLRAARPGQFATYRDALLQVLGSLATSRIGPGLSDRVAAGIAQAGRGDALLLRRLLRLTAVCRPLPRLVEELKRMVAEVGDPHLVVGAAESLARWGSLDESTIVRLSEALVGERMWIAARLLKDVPELPEAALDRLVAIVTGAEASRDTRAVAAQLLCDVRHLPESTSERLQDALVTGGHEATVRAAWVLALHDMLDPELCDPVIEAGVATDEKEYVVLAGAAVARTQELPDRLRSRLHAVLRESVRAVDRVPDPIRTDQLPPQLVEILQEIAVEGADFWTAKEIGGLLAKLDAMPVAVIDALVAATSTAGFHGGQAAHGALRGRDGLPPGVLERLINLVEEGDELLASSAADVLRLNTLPDAVISRMAKLGATAAEPAVAIRAASTLPRLDDMPHRVRARLLAIAADTREPDTLVDAAWQLARHGGMSQGVEDHLLAIIVAEEEPARILRGAAVLGQSGILPAAVVDRLAELADSGPEGVTVYAARLLRGNGALPVRAITALEHVVTGSPRSGWGLEAAELLHEDGRLGDALLPALVDHLVESDMPDVLAEWALDVLISRDELPAEVTRRLVELSLEDEATYHAWVAKVLAARGQLPPAVLERLLRRIVTSTYAYGASSEQEVLDALRGVPPDVLARLSEFVATDADAGSRQWAIRYIAWKAPNRETVQALIARLADADERVRDAAVESTARLIERRPEHHEVAIRLLYEVLNPHVDHLGEAPAEIDAAYALLWRLSSNLPPTTR